MKICEKDKKAGLMHLKQIQTPKTYMCKKCGKKFKDTKEIMKHVKFCTVEIGEIPAMKKPGLKSLAQKSATKQETSVDEKPPLIMCKICNSFFKDKHWHCEGCPQIFVSLELFENHKHFKNVEIQTEEILSESSNTDEHAPKKPPNLMNISLLLEMCGIKCDETQLTMLSKILHKFFQKFIPKSQLDKNQENNLRNIQKEIETEENVKQSQEDDLFRFPEFDEIKIEEHQIDPIESQIMDQTSQDNEMSSSPTKDLDSKKDILQEAVSQISADTTG